MLMLNVTCFPLDFYPNLVIAVPMIFTCEFHLWDDELLGLCPLEEDDEPSFPLLKQNKPKIEVRGSTPPPKKNKKFRIFLYFCKGLRILFKIICLTTLLNKNS